MVMKIETGATLFLLNKRDTQMMQRKGGEKKGRSRNPGWNEEIKHTYEYQLFTISVAKHVRS